MAQMGITPGSVSWKVEYQQEGYSTRPGEGLVKGLTVGFVTSQGVRGSVFLSEGDLKAGHAQDLLSAAVAERTALQNLTGEAPG